MAITIKEVETWVHFHKLSIKGHAGQALLGAAILDSWLRAAILTKMRPKLSKIKQDRLFDGFGPLAEFAAKIEVAFALDKIDDDIYAKLRIIRDIRNEFAHSPIECNFFKGEIAKLIDKFHCTDKATNPQIFDKMVEICFNHLVQTTDGGASAQP
jgi:DNA-binding MltR family transcriptional regulator